MVIDSFLLIVLSFIILNLIYYIYRKLRHKTIEGYTRAREDDTKICPILNNDELFNYNLDPLDNKNRNYLDKEFGMGDKYEIPLRGLGAQSCKDHKNYLEKDLLWSTGEIDDVTLKPVYLKNQYKTAIQNGCFGSLCQQITDDSTLNSFGKNQAEISDLYGDDEKKGLMQILNEEHKVNKSDTADFSNLNDNNGIIWSVDNASANKNFNLHSINENSEWSPYDEDGLDNYFSQKIGNNTTINGFEGITDSGARLWAWAKNSSDNSSKIFVCKKPCDGKNNFWVYDKFNIKANGKDFEIIDMTADNLYVWIIEKISSSFRIVKRPSSGGTLIPFINSSSAEYNKWWEDTSNNSTLIKQTNDIWWNNIVVDNVINRRAKYNPVKITNSSNDNWENGYIFILSKKDSSEKNGIHCCKKPCYGELWNWKFIYNDSASSITQISGDRNNENIIWFVDNNKLFKITIDETIFAVDGTTQFHEKQEVTNSIQNNIINVYGGDSKYLWVQDSENFLYGIERNDLSIKFTIPPNKSFNKFIVEYYKDNNPIQQKCSDGFSPNGENGKISCKENSKTETLLADNHCKYSECSTNDASVCCSVNAKCSSINDPTFCNTFGSTITFKDNSDNLYCSSKVCQKEYKDNNDGRIGQPHPDIFSCCDIDNIKNKRGSCQKSSTVSAEIEDDISNRLDNQPSWKFQKNQNQYQFIKENNEGLIDNLQTNWGDAHQGGLWKSTITEVDSDGNTVDTNIIDKRTYYPEVHKEAFGTYQNSAEELIKYRKEPGGNNATKYSSWNSIPGKITNFITNISPNNSENNYMTQLTNRFIGVNGTGDSYEDLDDNFKEKNDCAGWKAKFSPDAEKELCKTNWKLKNDAKLLATSLFVYDKNAKDNNNNRCCEKKACIRPADANMYNFEENDITIANFNVNVTGCKSGFKLSGGGFSSDACTADGEPYVLNGCVPDSTYQAFQPCIAATAGLRNLCSQRALIVDTAASCAGDTCYQADFKSSGSCCVVQPLCSGDSRNCGTKLDAVAGAKCRGSACEASDFLESGPCCKTKPQLCSSASATLSCGAGLDAVTDAATRCAGTPCVNSDFSATGNCCETSAGPAAPAAIVGPAAPAAIVGGGAAPVVAGTGTGSGVVVQTEPKAKWNEDEGKALKVKSRNKQYIYRKYGVPGWVESNDLKVEDCQITCEQNAGGVNWGKPCAGFNFKYNMPYNEPNKCLFFSSDSYSANATDKNQIPRDATKAVPIINAKREKPGSLVQHPATGSRETTWHTFWMPDAVESGEPFTNMREGMTTAEKEAKETEIKNAYNANGLGFTPAEWTSASNYFQTQIKGDKYEIENIPNSSDKNMPCTKNYTEYQYPDGTKDTNINFDKAKVTRDFVYQVGTHKFCPPFKPMCNNNICEGDLRKPIVPSTEDWDLIEGRYKSDRDITTNYIKDDSDKKIINPVQKISDTDLRKSQYCTNNILSRCRDGVDSNGSYNFCGLPDNNRGGYKKPGENEFVSATINDLETAGRVGENGVYAPVAYDNNKELKLIGCSEDVDCNTFGTGFTCIEGVCVGDDGQPASSANNQKMANSVRDTGTVTDNLYEAENLDLTKDTADSKFKNYFDSEIKRFKLDESGTIGESLDKQDYSNLGKTLNILKTRYIFTFNLEKKVIYWLERTRGLEKINLDIKNELNKFKDTKEYKEANGGDMLKLSYNKEAVIKALLKLGKTNKNFSYINLEWISTRIEKTKDNCDFDKDNGFCNNSLLFTEDLDEQSSQWGLIKRKAYKKKEQELTSNWKKLSDSDDAGKYLYKKSKGPRGSRKTFDGNYQSPYENNYILLGN